MCGNLWFLPVYFSFLFSFDSSVVNATFSGFKKEKQQQQTTEKTCLYACLTVSGCAPNKMMNLLPDLDQGITALLESLDGPKHNVPEIQIQDK